MATKTAHLYARIEPQTKLHAESILEALGIPVSIAIDMFYRQIILNNGLPFDLKLPQGGGMDISRMTESQFNAEMERAYQQMLDGKGVSVDQAFLSIKRVE